MAGYFGESGTTVTWKNPQFVPENQRQNGGWYYNPSTNRVDRWWNQGSGPNAGGGGGGQQQQQQQHVPSADEIMRAAADEKKRKFDEQNTFLKQFLGSNPMGFDALLARSMEEQRWNPYYETVLNEFVNPLKEKLTQSQSREKQLLDELVRQKTFGESSKKQELANALETAKGGLAEAGTYGGGGASRALTTSRLTGEQSLSDFLAQNASQQEQARQAEEGTQKLTQMDIDTQTAQTARKKQEDITTGVETQRLNAAKQAQLKATNEMSNRYGADLQISNLPDYLQYYYQ